WRRQARRSEASASSGRRGAPNDTTTELSLRGHPSSRDGIGSSYCGPLQKAAIADDTVEVDDAAGSEANERDARREQDALENLALPVDDVIQKAPLRRGGRARNDPQIALEIGADGAWSDRRFEVRELVDWQGLKVDRQSEGTVGCRNRCRRIL